MFNTTPRTIVEHSINLSAIIRANAPRNAKLENNIVTNKIGIVAPLARFGATAPTHLV